MSWLTKFFTSGLAKVLVVILAMGLIVVMAVENKSMKASAQTNPEKFIADTNGQPRQSFSTGESANLTLRGYAEDLPSSYNKADIILLMDRSGSMGTDKCTESKNAAISFVNNISTDKDTSIGIISYADLGTAVQNLTVVSPSTNKAAITSLISWTCGGATNMSDAVDQSTTMINNFDIANPSRNASRYIVLFTDGGENTGAPLTGNWFLQSQANNPTYTPTPSSKLYISKNKPVKYFTIYYGPGGGADKCTYDINDGGTGPTAPQSWGCPLMRYVAGYTNDVQLDTGLNWQSDYGDVPSVDNSKFYKVENEADLTKIYDTIIQYIQAANTSLNFYEKLNTGVQYVSVGSVRDKGRRWVGVNKIETLADGTIKFTMPKLAGTYTCNTGETACLAAATNGVITNNYVDLKLKVTFSGDANGKFDLDSNYLGCDVGNPVFDSAKSRVEYINPQNGSTIGNPLPMPVMCLNILDPGAGLVISKSTYLIDPNNGEQTLQGSFQAGDEVSVKIFVNEILPSRQTWKIEDGIPSFVTKLTKNPTLTTPGSGSNAGLTSVINADSVVIQNRSGDPNSALLGGVNIIEYHYKI